jgi:hypothetical protein
MNSKSRFGAGCSTRQDLTMARRRSLLRCAVFVAAAGALAGCTGDVAMRIAQTGKIETCQDYLLGLNPWSQTMACVAGREAQGWTRVN